MTKSAIDFVWETAVDYKASPEVPPCPVGPEGHEWSLAVIEGSVSFGSGCEQCDEAVLGPIGNDALEMPTEVFGKIKFTPEHPNLGGWHGDMRCDCGYWWEFMPTRFGATHPAENCVDSACPSHGTPNV